MHSVFLRASVVALLTLGLTLPNPAFAQEPAALPDSTLSVLTGRSVIVSTTAGLAVEGEFVAFDEQSVTVLRADGQVVVVPRGDVASISVVTTPTPESPNDSAQPQPAEPTPPANATTEVAPGVKTKAVSSETERAELAVLLERGGLPPECLADRSSPACVAMLQQGVKELDRLAVRNNALGFVFMGLGLGVSCPLGAWLVITGDKIKKAEEACADVGGSSCGRTGKNRMIGGYVTLGTAFLFVGVMGVALAHGSRAKRAAQRIRKEHNLAWAPAFGRGLVGVSLQGRF